MSRRHILFKSLNNLCKELDEIYQINSGGCCFVAAVIAEQLERFNIRFKVCYYDEFGIHYAIKVNNWILNRDKYKNPHYKNLSSKEIYHIYNTEDWNEMYSCKNNKIILLKIKNLFDKYGGV